MMSMTIQSIACIPSPGESQPGSACHPRTLALRGIARRQRQGFTLIELLVSVSIIAVLASLMFPALRLTKQAAQATVCSSQLRQVGLAMLGYAGDNDGFIPPLYHVTPEWTWDDYLAAGEYDGRSLSQSVLDNTCVPYDQSGKSVYVCPADSAPDGGANYWRRTYAMPNGFMTGISATGSPAPRPSPESNPAAAAYWGIADQDWSMSLSQIRTSVVLMLTEFPTNDAQGIWNILGNMSGAQIGAPSTQIGRTLHGNRSNYLYCDGHVVTQRPQETVMPGGSLTQPRGGWTRNGQQ